MKETDLLIQKCTEAQMGRTFVRLKFNRVELKKLRSQNSEDYFD